MSDIELVIKIPEEIQLALINNIQLSMDQQSICDSYIKHAITNGTPLPKGHGRLIDADYLKDVILLHNFHGNNKNIVPYSDRRGYRLRQREVDEGIINAPTIIEADKEDK